MDKVELNVICNVIGTLTNTVEIAYATKNAELLNKASNKLIEIINVLNIKTEETNV